MIYDISPDEYYAVVGLHLWLAPEKINGLEIITTSVRVHHPGLVVDLCRSAAGLWTSALGTKLSKTPDRWRQLASDIEQPITEGKWLEPDESSEDFCYVTVVRDQSHSPLIRESARIAQMQLSIFSQSIGANASTDCVKTLIFSKSKT